MKTILGNISPELIKKTYRWFRYGHERKRLVRENGIRRRQNELLPKLFVNDNRPLVVFVVQGADRFSGKDNISGGAISIMSLCEETRKLNEQYGFQTIMCTMHGEVLLEKHEQFENNTPVFRFEQLHPYFTQSSVVTFHIPEYMTEKFVTTLSVADRLWFQERKMVHINIMNQNIRLMPRVDIIAKVKNVTDKVTITTAHQKYCTPIYREKYGVPIHKFSVWISPEQYRFVEWKDKDNLIVVSPDEHSMKSQVLEQLKSIPGLKVQIIKNLTYNQYKELISRAKWSLTFGEGLDGYLIEPVFSGAIGFAVYNEDFFTPDYKELKTIYSDYNDLSGNIHKDIVKLDVEKEFENYQKKIFQICAYHYSKEQYLSNVKAFYDGQYTHP